jgi:hypothetical protein
MRPLFAGGGPTLAFLALAAVAVTDCSGSSNGKSDGGAGITGSAGSTSGSAGASGSSGNGSAGADGGAGAGAGSGGGAGSAGAGATPTFMSTLPAATPLAQISLAQLTTICTELNAYRSNLAKSAGFAPVDCKYAGIFSGMSTVGPVATDDQVRQACSTAVSNCVATPTQPFTLDCSVAPFNDCAATVAQYTACLNDSVAAAEVSVASLPSCSALSVALFRSDSGSVMSLPTLTAPASCVTYAAACPTSAGDIPPPLISPEVLSPNP